MCFIGIIIVIISDAIVSTIIVISFLNEMHVFAMPFDSLAPHQWTMTVKRETTFIYFKYGTTYLRMK